MKDSAASVDGFLNTEGMDGIPLGIDAQATDFGRNPPYQKNLAPYCKRYKCNEDAEDAVRLYRRLLAESDEAIELIEIGYLQALANLLESEGDDLSPLTGIELVRRRVKKIWIMAGKWDENPGRENNFNRNARACRGGHIVCKICPVPITFLGWEIGTLVVTGGELHRQDPLHHVLCDFGSPEGRKSWDPMLALLAVTGDAEAAGYDTVSGTARVDAQTGENYFSPSPDGPHRYVKMKFPPAYYEEQINRRIRSTEEYFR
jgi:hypothetical protein